MTRSTGHNPEAIRALVREHGPGIRAYFAARVADWAAAEDLVQETFVAALQDQDAYRNEGTFSAWLYGVARNRLRLYYRRQARSRNALTSLREEIAVLADSANEVADVPLLKRERVQQLHSCIENLPERAATAIRGRYFESREIADLAKLLETTEAATYMFLTRVRRQLGNCMKEALS